MFSLCRCARARLTPYKSVKVYRFAVNLNSLHCIYSFSICLCLIFFRFFLLIVNVIDNFVFFVPFSVHGETSLYFIRRTFWTLCIWNKLKVFVKGFSFRKQHKLKEFFIWCVFLTKATKNIKKTQFWSSADNNIEFRHKYGMSKTLLWDKINGFTHILFVTFYRKIH